MPLPLFTLIGFSVWTLTVLVLGVGIHRWSRILAGGARLSDFPGDVPHGTELYRRMVRAHANCVETLPIFASLVLTASALDYRSLVFDNLCTVALFARLSQTSIHIASGSDRAIALRFAAFAVQLCALFTMAALILGTRV